MSFVIVFAGYLAFVAILAIVLDWRFPSCSRRNLVLASALPVPAAIAVTGVGWAVVILSQPAAPGKVDAGGMTFAVVTGVAAVASLVTLAVGLAAAWIVSRWLRRDEGSEPSA